MTRIPADERRVRLVEAAIRVMVRDGVAKATTRAIVAEAQMPLGVFHYCFRSKHELLGAVVETILSRTLVPALAEARRPGDLRHILRASVQAYWDHVEAYPGEHQLTYELTQYALREEGLVDVARRQYERYVAAELEFFRAVADVAGIEWATPADVLARHVLGVLDGLTLQWLVNRDSAAAVEVLDALADHVAAQAVPARTPCP